MYPGCIPPHHPPGKKLLGLEADHFAVCSAGGEWGMICVLKPRVYRKNLPFQIQNSIYETIYFFFTERENIFPLLLGPNDPLRSSQCSASQHHLEFNACCPQPETYFRKLDCDITRTFCCATALEIYALLRRYAA
jgi:hypothetical protein